MFALGHLRWGNDEKLAAGAPEIDLVFGGHDHDSGDRIVCIQILHCILYCTSMFSTRPLLLISCAKIMICILQIGKHHVVKSGADFKQFRLVTLELEPGAEPLPKDISAPKVFDNHNVLICSYFFCDYYDYYYSNVNLIVCRCG